MELAAPLVNNLKSHIRYPTSIRINNKITQNFYGNQQTGVNGSMKSYSSGWDGVHLYYQEQQH